MELKGNLEFNSLKHHLNYTIKRLTEVNRNNINQFNEELNEIGNNIFDLYIGKLSTNKIVEELQNTLLSEKIIDKKNYEYYLGIEGYKKLEVSDGSQWILRLGTMNQAFIHIHPARNGKFTNRITGSTWKTAIALKLFEVELQKFDNLLDKMNFVRKKYLKLSPVKTLKKNSNIIKAIYFLSK